MLKEAFLAYGAALATGMFRLRKDGSFLSAHVIIDTKPEDRAARKSHKFSPIFAPAEKLAKLPPLYMRHVMRRLSRKWILELTSR